MASSRDKTRITDDAGIDCIWLATDLLRALRGRRSRPNFSRYLGYASNIAQRWETRECWPTAVRFFGILRRLRIDTRQSLEVFFRQEPPWLAGVDLESAAGVGLLLSELRGRTPLSAIAERSGYNRYSVSRWLQGTADPKLPELLRLIEALSRRVIDFVESIVDPHELPSVAARFRQLEIARSAAFERPLSHAVLRALELTGIQETSSRRDVAYLASRISAPECAIADALKVLVASGQAQKTRHGWRVQALPMIDTGGDRARSRALKASWVRLALERMEAGAPGNFGYSVFAISRPDLLRLKEIQLAFVREMQAVIAGSTDTDCVGLYCAQLLDLAPPPDNAFADPGR
jgi:transcriptional regulator with XRE-family HTH domain